MATTIADLLDALSSEATTHHPAPGGSADADRALGLLGRVLHHTVDQGLTPTGGTERERWVRVTAHACTDDAPDVHTATPGRLTQLSGAVWDALCLHRDDLTCDHRWAIALAVAEPVAQLTALVDPDTLSITRRRALIVAQAGADVVQRSGALDPPSPRTSAVLDRPVPRPTPWPNNAPAAAIREAIAGLDHATHRDARSLSIAGFVSVTMALEDLSRSAVSLIDSRDPALPGAARATAEGWAAARAVLKPFDDGSRRPDQAPPPVVHLAMALRDALHRADTEHAKRDPERPAPDPVRDAVRDALQRVPTIAGALTAAVAHWADTGTAIAYARDLDYRDHRIDEYLAGHRPGGLVVADVTDLRPAHEAIGEARLLSVDLAARASAPGHVRGTSPHLAAANQYARTEISTDRLQAAAMESRRALQMYAGPPRAARGPGR